MGIVIIGNGPAAISAMEAIRKVEQDCEIIVISKEKEPAYTPCFLYRYVSGEIGKERLYMRAEDFYDKNKIKTVFGVAAIEIIPNDKKVRLSDGNEILYDSLLIAAGANPVIPQIPGIEGDGVFSFKTVADADRILSIAKKSKEAVIVGAGFIGLEIAEALHRCGLTVTVVEREDRILPRMLDIEIAEIIKKHIQGNGVKILTGREVISIERDKNNKIKAVVLDKDDTISCDFLIAAVGVRPNLAMLKNGFINTGRGILVDKNMQTSIPNIYAAGDIAEMEVSGIRKINPIHMNAAKGGWIAGCNMTRNMTDMTMGFDAHLEDMNVVTLFGLSVLSHGIQRGDEVIKRQNSKGTIKIYLKEDDSINGVQIIGDVSRGGLYLSLMRKGIPVSEKLDILSAHFNYGFTLSGIKYL